MPTRQQETNIRRFAAGAISGKPYLRFKFNILKIYIRWHIRCLHIPTRFNSSPHGVHNQSIRQVRTTHIRTGNSTDLQGGFKHTVYAKNISRIIPQFPATQVLSGVLGNFGGNGAIRRYVVPVLGVLAVQVSSALQGWA